MSYIVRAVTPPEPAFNIQSYFIESDEFLSDATLGSINWTATVSGTGAAVTADNTQITSATRALGVYALSTGTTTTGRAALTKNVTCILLGYAAVNFSSRIKLDTVSTATQRYTSYFGIIDNGGAGDMTDGCYFRQVDNVNSGNWQCVSRSNTTETVVNTSTAPDTNFHHFQIMANDAGTQVDYFIDNANVGSITTNIPTGAGRFTATGWKVIKSVGTTARLFYIDSYQLLIAWATPR